VTFWPLSKCHKD